MNKLLSYFSPYKKEAILAPLMKCMEALLDLFVPLVIAALVDRGILQREDGFLWKAGLLLFGLAALGLALSTVAQWFSAKAATSIASTLRDQLFRHIQSLSFADGDRIGTSTLITRLTSDVNQVQTGINMTLRLLLRSPFIVFGAMIMALAIDTSSGLIFVLVIPLLALVVYGIMGITVPLYKKIQQKLDQVVLRVRENLTGVRVIRAFRLEERETAAFTSANLSLTQEGVRTGRISALTNPLTFLLIQAATIALLYVAGRRVFAGRLSQGQVVALAGYMAQVLVELVKLANLIVTMTKGVASFGRIQEILSFESTQKSGTAAYATLSSSKGASLSFRDVSFQYPGSGAEALSHISFDAAPGERIGIIGSTGSGKSSLVSLIPRFYDHTGGQILLNHQPVESYDLFALREKISFVMQKTTLFAGTIRENLRYADPHASDEALWEALSAAQARSFVEEKAAADPSLASGLDFMVEQGGRNLSGGQRQRLSIARALVRKSEILILDDSASALDFATEKALRQSIAALPSKPTLLVVSQRIASIRDLDKILVLLDGTLCGLGTHDELLKTNQIYQEIYATQYADEASARKEVL